MCIRDREKLKLRVYELVNDVDEGGEDGDENAGVSAPADDDAARKQSRR